MATHRSSVILCGDKSALSESAQRGLKVFVTPKKGNYRVCHIIGTKFALFTDNKFHNIGVSADTRGEFADPGRYAQTDLLTGWAEPS